jgi:RNA polymerase-binding transcription factor DksA
MPDHMDRVQDAVQAATDAAVAQATAPKRGATHCEECGEPIGEYRVSLGARLCLPHQREAEQRQRFTTRGSRR